MLKLVTEVMHEKLLCTVVLRRKACRADLRYDKTKNTFTE